MVNSRVPKSAVSNSANGHVKMLMRVPDACNETVPKVKGVESEGFAVYSPGRNKKKNARTIMSLMQ